MTDKTNKQTKDLDYGHNKPTGGTNQNTGKINPQGPSSGTANYHPDKKNNEQSTAGGDDSPLDDGRNAQDWTSTSIPLDLPVNAPGNFSTGPVSPNAGDVQDESGDLNPGASATPGAGAGATGDRHSFRCADSGNGDCRWETSMASSEELWADIERHNREAHGKPTLDSASRGRIQDAIHVRRAA